MNTITIEDPREVEARLKAAFPDALMAWASFSCHKGKNQWQVSATPIDSRPHVVGYGATADDAIAEALAKHQANTPPADLSDQAAKLGYKLVPA